MLKLIYASTKNADMRYLIGLDILDDFFLIENNSKQYIFLDKREQGFFETKNKKRNLFCHSLEEIIEQAKLIDADTSLTNKIALHLINKYGEGEKQIEVSRDFPLEMADFLRSLGIILKIKDPFIPERIIKSETEKNFIKENLKRTQKAFLKIEEILNASKIDGDLIVYENEPLTSEFLKKQCEKVLLDEDMLDTEGMIISCGIDSSIPHHRGEGLIRPYQTIVCDIFPKHRGNAYFADMTRTYIKGQPSNELLRMYEKVEGAQELAIENVKAGVKNIDVHGKVQNFFLDSGYHLGEKGFVHGTGHGLGIEIHEKPYINASAGDTKLEVGNVLTIEPGLYYNELGGVRIEDVVYVTEDGCENLTNYPKEFVIL